MTAIASGQVAVATTPVEIVAARVGRTQLRLYGLGSFTSGTYVLLGHDNTVTVQNGYFESGALVLPTDGAIFGISTSGQLNVSFLEVY